MSKNICQKLENGKLSRLGLLSPDALDRAVVLIEQVDNASLEIVRVVFPDQHGILRGKAIVADALSSVFSDGLCVPSTLLLKDTSCRTVFPVWSESSGIGDDPMNGAGDILLVPDVGSFRELPWSNGAAWLFCHSVYKNGSPIPFDPRSLLIRANETLHNQGMKLTVGLEVEFHIYERISDGLDHGEASMPASAPQTRLISPGYQLLHDGHYGASEEILNVIRENAHGLGLPIRSLEIEMGPGQFEVTFDPASPLEHADNMMMFRAMCKEVCAERGLLATFMCRPKCENAASSGWHLHQSISDLKTGDNLFMPSVEGELTPTASHWIAGLLDMAKATCLLTTPTVNGYKRYQPYQLAPDRVQWGRDNRGAMIRALDYPNDKASRIENRVAETAANPYYYFASQIYSGLHGLENKLQAPNPIEMPYESEAHKLPSNLGEAISDFKSSITCRRMFGDAFVDYLTRIKQAEWDRYLSQISDWEQDEYFDLY